MHKEIEVAAQQAAVEIIDAGATHGLLLLSKLTKPSSPPPQQLSAEDILVRLGQRLSRWCALQEPAIAIRIGVHCGSVNSLILPKTSKLVYYGEAVQGARQLMQTAPAERVVHLLKSTKDALVELEKLPFTRCQGLESFYLDTTAPDLEEIPFAMRTMTTVDSSKAARIERCTDEFRELLIQHGVDVSRLGTGQAKTLDEFYTDVMVEKKSRLVARSGALERHLEMAVITLLAQGSDGVDRELKLASEVLEDGKVIRRNLRPVVHLDEATPWETAVAEFFTVRLQTPADVWRRLFHIDHAAYNKKVERVIARFFPCVTTAYTTHTVVVRVSRPSDPSVQALGLPKGANFTTPADKDAGVWRANWSWRKKGEEVSNEEALMQLLQENGIDTADFPPDAFSELCAELYEDRLSTLVFRDDALVRSIHVIKVWICATILSVEYVLLLKSKVTRGKLDAKAKTGPVTMRMKSDQEWKEAARECLKAKLGMDAAFQQAHLLFVDSSYLLAEEVDYSRSFPGLKTVYHIHTVKCRVKDVDKQEMSFIGLPDGNDFTFVRSGSGPASPTAGEARADGLVANQWCWKPRAQLTDAGDFLYFQKHEDDVLDGGKMVGLKGASLGKRQLEPPSPPTVTGKPAAGSLVVENLMKGRETNWDRARNAARRIRDPKYTLKEYYQDCKAAFPELALYVVEGGDHLSSGRSGYEEYQRTVCALFSFFWLMRRTMDGAQAFCFGVGEDWLPLTVESKWPARSDDEKIKREQFLKEVDWQKTEDLLLDAGLLVKKPGSDLSHDPDRVLAMLVLTAIHDVMKVVALLPVVAKKYAGFGGYKAGETIADHDIALGYVLSNFPNALPSFAGLPKKLQESLAFTQLKMEYNMGWLVQAEAPPGALFKKFKKCVVEGSAPAHDVALYFCHWLTDLAGAEPYPQDGCEKFVLKFPRKVLSSFLDSFTTVSQLATKSETQVFEDYLMWRWERMSPRLGAAPWGPGSIAKMRLVVMAQGDNKAILRAWRHLAKDDADILSSELAMTGSKGQLFRSEMEGTSPPKGPAILVYYAPALMQHAGATNPKGALRILSEVFRQARTFWPATAAGADETVTVRIDALKELEVHAIMQLTAGDVWVLVKTTSKDAEVRKINLGSENPPVAGEAVVLNFAAPSTRKNTRALSLGNLLRSVTLRSARP